MNEIQPGILLINKPRGRSSFSMVAQVRRISGIKKVGHAGTLDPEAEGLMIVLVGKEFTKQADTFLKQDKTYQFTLKLGETSSTDDVEGEKTKVSDRKPTKAEIVEALRHFTGAIQQTPPAYSAIKVGGQRAYKLARKGQEVALQPREVTVAKLELISYSYPELTLVADVSSGTYIRALAKDLGTHLGTGAYATQIIRTRIGLCNLADAMVLD